VSSGPGEEESYRAFVAARYTALRRTAYVLTGNHHDAEDLVQTALMKAAGVWRRIEERPEPYVRRIMYHENVSAWRRRRVTEEPLGSHDSALEVGDSADDRLVLAEALSPCRTSSAPSWCCATTRTSPNSRQPPSWGSGWGR
jgi:DNA-directed RNA polymerase specialized sigma24 family protein